jgi:hypothetical protein
MIYFVFATDTGDKISVPIRTLSSAKETAVAFHRATGRHCYVIQAETVWTTSQIGDLGIEGGVA